MRIAVYGGSFDPPHRAHLLAVDHVLATGQVDRVLVVPVYRHAFSKQMAPFDDRVRMCELTFDRHPNVEICAIEAELPPPSFTVQTLEALGARFPGATLRFVVGADALRDSHKWHRFERVVELAPLIVLGRVGVPHPGAPEPVLPGASSSEIRERLAAWRGDAAGRAELLEVLSPAVLEFIERRRLYGVRQSTTGSRV